MATMRKVFTLPGIDNSGRELYESPDPPDRSQIDGPPDRREDAADIDTTSVDPKQALARFRTPVVLEALGEGPSEEVPVPAKVRLGEVNSELLVLTSDLHALLQEVVPSSADTSSTSAGETGTPTPVVPTPPTVPAEVPTNPTPQQLLALDRRLAVLEAAVGTPAVGGAASTGPLHTVLSRMEQHVEMMDGEVLDALARRMRTVERDMDKVLAKKRQHTSADDMKRINQVYEGVQRCDAVGPQVPVILNRLVSLKALHDEAGALRGWVHAAQEREATIDQALGETARTLKLLEESFAGNVAAIQSNIEVLDKRMADLAEKSAALTA